MTNEEKVKKYYIKKIIRYLRIITCLAVIFLEGLALFGTISYVWGLIPFIIGCVLKYIAEKDKKEKKDTKKKK